jgi:hypothetical protein
LHIIFSQLIQTLLTRVLASPYTVRLTDSEVAKWLSQLCLLEDFHFFWWESALRLILYYYIKERFVYFFQLTIFSKCIAFHSYWVCIHWNEMYKTKCNRCASVFFSVHSPEIKYTKRSAIGCIFQCSFTGNEMYKTKLPLFASKEKHVGKKHYLFLHKDFDRSKKLSQFTFNGQTFSG